MPNTRFNNKENCVGEKNIRKLFVLSDQLFYKLKMALRKSLLIKKTHIKLEL